MHTYTLLQRDMVHVLLGSEATSQVLRVTEEVSTRGSCTLFFTLGSHGKESNLWPSNKGVFENLDCFRGKLQYSNRAKTRGSKRTLQGTVSSILKISVSCLLQTFFFYQALLSVSRSCLPVALGQFTESQLFPFYLPSCWQAHPLSLPLIKFLHLFLICLSSPTAICSHFPQSFQVSFGFSKPSALSL